MKVTLIFLTLSATLIATAWGGDLRNHEEGHIDGASEGGSFFSKLFSAPINFIKGIFSKLFNRQPAQPGGETIINIRDGEQRSVAAGRG